MGTLAENGYVRKPAAAKVVFGHISRMGARTKAPRTNLQRIFLKRVREELDARGLSENALSKRVGGPAQKTLNGVMNGTDPRLATVSQIAEALGIQPWKLLTEGAEKGATLNIAEIDKLARPRLLGQPDKGPSNKVSTRRMRRA